MFSLLKGTKECHLAPGLSLPVVLCYTPNEYCEHTGEIQIFVDDVISATVPVKGYVFLNSYVRALYYSNTLHFRVLPMAHFIVDNSELDFGIQVDEYHVASKKFLITNSGDEQGLFCLHNTIPSYLTILPSSGVIQPKHSLQVSVELLCNQVGEIDECIQ